MSINEINFPALRGPDFQSTAESGGSGSGNQEDKPKILEGTIEVTTKERGRPVKVYIVPGKGGMPGEVVHIEK